MVGELSVSTKKRVTTHIFILPFQKRHQTPSLTISILHELHIPDDGQIDVEGHRKINLPTSSGIPFPPSSSSSTTTKPPTTAIVFLDPHNQDWRLEHWEYGTKGGGCFLRLRR